MFGQNNYQGPNWPPAGGGLFDELIKLVKRLVIALGSIGLIVLIIYLAWITIPAIASVITDLVDHISDLFRDAPRLHSKHGQSAFIQLILIAVFVGWVLSRVKKK